MKLVILNTDDSGGGAAIATYRLHRGLRSISVDSQMMVWNKNTDDPTVIRPELQSIFKRASSYLYKRRESRLTILCYAKEKKLFSPARCPDNLADSVAAIKPDMIHLSWVASGFMKIETLKQFKKPIVWTLHDMWPFTGGCHYDHGCERFRHSCGKCPILNSASDHDLSRQIWERKRKSWGDVPIVVVTPSHWLAEMARSSSLFRDQRIEIIPNGIDTEKFRPLDKRTAREAYDLPQDRHLVLFSAFNATSDERKGNQFLVPALNKMALAGWGEKIELVVTGASEPENPPDLGMKVHYMGKMHDEISQALLYSAADVTVAPSTQENLSNTVMESLSCGTPVVAFNIGGMPDMIDHKYNGYLAKAFDSDDLAAGIMWALENKGRHDMLSQRARKTATDRYALKAVANRYLALYQSILK
jgi:glycosyltransferase involved in cell wall biosynthesis